MRRRLLGLAALVVLVGLAGCSGVFGPGEPDPEQLNENATYEWETNATASITVNRSSFAAVYALPAENDTLEVYTRDGLGRERHLQISALRYRYENGTQIRANDSEALTVTQTRQRTEIDLPNGTAGQVAFTAPRHGKQFSTPVFVEGSYEVTLPPNARVGIPLLSQVSPGDYETSVDDESERMTVRWDSVESRSMQVRYYLERDLLLFGGVALVAVLVGSGGALYYYRQIKQLERRRKESGVDVDYEDDDIGDDGPPPGMR